MASESYLNIKQKLQSSGRQYYEGLDSSDFLGLTDDERLAVVRELKVRAEQGDGVSLAALKYVLAEDELSSFVKDTLEKHEAADLFSAQLVTILASRTNNEAVWSKLLSILSNATSEGRLWILSHVESDWIPASTLDGYAGAVAMFIAREDDPVNRLIASGSLLTAVGKQPRSADYVRLSAGLRSNVRAKRIEALNELGFDVIPSA